MHALFSKLTTSWDATPTDDTYFIRQDTGGTNQFGRVKFSTIWAYIRGKTDGIYSAYRTPAYNISIGGSSKSQHCLGLAADIRITGVDPIQIALYASSLPFYAKQGGIGYYSRVGLKDGFVHVDVRNWKSRWISKTGTAYMIVHTIMPTIRLKNKDCANGISYAVTVLQRHLGITADGIFGANTKTKLIEYQKAHGLSADGICGPATWSSFK